MQATRRDLIKIGISSAAIISLGGTVPVFLSKFAFADAPIKNNPVSPGNILVVVQLSGGNDGLNCVVPYADDLYYKARPVIGVKDKTLKLDDHLALNPSMASFKELFDAGQLAIINGCGYPQPNRSHFRSMEIWQTADPQGFQPCGWLGHYLDHQLRGTNNPLSAVNIGSQLPQALIADGAPTPSVQSIEDFGVRIDSGSANPDLQRRIIKDLSAVHESTPALQFLSRQATNAIVTADQIHKLTAGYKSDVAYPRGLGDQLKLIAQIISGNFGTRLYYCEIGGFDTHSNQSQGHGQLLGTVAAAIAAFHKDLAAKGINDKVMVMCFSEFGRRVHQNDSNGTDHGAAAPMFVSGGKIKGGLLGQYPSLAALDDGDLKYSTDFRRVYATILEKWLAADSAAVLQNKFETMEFI